MSARGTVEAYYAALRAGEPLAPFFAEREDLVKFGITERLEGHGEVAAGLREQTRTTTGWTVESRALRAPERGDVAWFSDDVRLAWTDDDGRRREYDSRWSGTLLRDDGGSADGGTGSGGASTDAGGGRTEPGGTTTDATGDRPEWRFVGMHVSAPH